MDGVRDLPRLQTSILYNDIVSLNGKFEKLVHQLKFRLDSTGVKGVRYMNRNLWLCMHSGGVHGWCVWPGPGSSPAYSLLSGELGYVMSRQWVHQPQIPLDATGWKGT